MDTITISARVRFAGNCLRGANAAAARGQRRVAAELRASAREALSEVSAATARLREPTPAQERARAYAATVLQGFGAR